MANPSGPTDASLFRWRFGAVEFDESRHELRIAGLPVDMEHKPLQVLAVLLRHVGEVVTKEELFEAVWAGRVTVDHVLATAVGKLRKALDAAGENRIATVPRVGYRLDGPVERVAQGQRLDRAMSFEAGQPVPGRDHFLLERPLGRTLGSEVWLARQPRSRDARVFKFSLGGERLSAIKREATLMRVLRDTLGERDDFVRVLDWNFETEPYFLECEFGGVSLPDWVANHDVLAGWDTAQRLGFFLQVATAVDAAHGVGVLHKDIKPANVLVRQRQPGGWQACLTDFGNSRLLQPERLAELGITGMGLTVTHAGSDSSGTPLYLAPEVVAGQPPTVRSDLYALGILLYQVLIGDLRRPMAPGWERDIADPLLVDDITRATDGDPSRRLGSVAELIQRLSQLEQRRDEAERSAQAARDAELSRQSLERTRARRPWIAATIGVLSIGLLASSALWYRSELQRRDAALQAARAEAVARFLSDDLIGTLSPGGSGFERDPTVREMLEQAGKPLTGRFGDDPATRGSIHAALGDAWRTLGDRERAATHLRAAIEDYTRAFGADDELTLKARYGLVRTLAYAGSADGFAEARSLLDEADRLAGARLAEDGEIALHAAIARGQYHFQRLEIEPSLEAHRRADPLQRRLHPDEAPMAALIRSSIADAMLRLGRTEEAEQLLRTLLSDPLLAPERIGESTVAGYRIMLARALRSLGRYDEALPLAEAAASTSERILGPDNYTTLVQMSVIASIHDYAGDCAKALPIARTVRERMAKRYGENRQATLIETGNLGFKEYDCGDRETGLAWLGKAESGLRRHFGEDNVAAHSFRYALARALTEQRRYAEALAMVDGLNVAALTAGDATPGWELRLRALRGRILVLAGDADTGRPLLAEAVPALEALGTEEPSDIAALQQLLAAPD
ncbi:protein kinase domain-containing protein [Arenimonas terrae]|jgi:DNA-binding winged helix-turn-helix (wHTH) protein/serine/threonine protein kinase|nr:winged helix-turn-helix domain-containing protein [Arenimonas terrae]